MGRIVGRDTELELLVGGLSALETRRTTVSDVSGEAGIGKTALLGSFAAAARLRGASVLTGRASEFDRDRPFGVVADALDRHVERMGSVVVAELGARHLGELAAVFPSVAPAPTHAAHGHERHRLHRAVRALLELLAGSRGLALILDDLHWADAASIDLIAAIVRHPPEAPLALALAHRPAEGLLPLLAELEHAAGTGRAQRIVLRPLTDADASALLPASLAPSAARDLLAISGGNPFYLEQLVRAQGATPPGTAPAAVPQIDGVPPAVATALAVELAPLPSLPLALLQAGALAGESFDVDLAQEIAGCAPGSALEALDVLVSADLIREIDTPRWFRFRHPIVRHAVYRSIPAGVRLAGHARAADVLAGWGASPAARAHHVEQSARRGDVGAVALLTAAGEEAAPRAPAAAAGWYAAALRLLPDDAAADQRRALLLRRGAVLAATGRFEKSLRMLTEALALDDGQDREAHARLIGTTAALDRLLGRFDHARAQLTTALDAVADPRSPEAIVLLLELAAHASLAADFVLMHDSALTALNRAVALGDRVLRAAAMAPLGFAEYSVGHAARAEVVCAEAAVLIGELDLVEVGAHPEMMMHLGWAEWFMGRFADAGDLFALGVEASRASGRAALVIELMVGQALSASGCGRVADGVDIADAAVEEARLIGNEHTLVWALFAQCIALEPAQPIEAAVQAGEEAVLRARRQEPSTVSAGCGWALASALVEQGHGQRARAVMLELQGGPDLPMFFPGHRAACYEVLTRAELLEGRVDAAAGWVERARAASAADGRPFSQGMADRAEARLLGALGQPGPALVLAQTAAAALTSISPVEAARTRMLAGGALVDVGDRDGAARHFRGAEDAFAQARAGRLQQTAVRELRRIGRRVNRRGRVLPHGSGTLSPREREVAELVAGGMTNRAVAARLFLSEKTVESHVAGVFVKLGVRSRDAIDGALRRDRGRG